MFDSESIQLLLDTVKATQAPKLLHECSRKKTFLVGLDQLVSVPIDAPPRRHQVRTVGDMLQASLEWADGAGVVFHDDSGIVLICDDADDRRDRVFMNLELSPQVAALSRGELFPHRELMRLLRRDLSGCVDTGFLSMMAKVSFAAQTESSSQRGSESLGRSVHAAVSGADQIPEFTVVEIPIYTIPDLSEPQRLKVLVDVDFDNNQIYFKPAPGELDNAILRVQGQLHDLLVDGQKCPVFYGTPRE